MGALPSEWNVLVKTAVTDHHTPVKSSHVISYLYTTLFNRRFSRTTILSFFYDTRHKLARVDASVCCDFLLLVVKICNVENVEGGTSNRSQSDFAAAVRILPFHRRAVAAGCVTVSSISSPSFLTWNGHQPLTRLCLKSDICGTEPSVLSMSSVHSLDDLAPRGNRFMSSVSAPARNSSSSLIAAAVTDTL